MSPTRLNDQSVWKHQRIMGRDYFQTLLTNKQKVPHLDGDVCVSTLHTINICLFLKTKFPLNTELFYFYTQNYFTMYKYKSSKSVSYEIKCSTLVTKIRWHHHLCIVSLDCNFRCISTQVKWLRDSITNNKHVLCKVCQLYTMCCIVVLIVYSGLCAISWHFTIHSLLSLNWYVYIFVHKSPN